MHGLLYIASRHECQVFFLHSFLQRMETHRPDHHREDGSPASRSRSRSKSPPSLDDGSVWQAYPPRGQRPLSRGQGPLSRSRFSQGVSDERRVRPRPPTPLPTQQPRESQPWLPLASSLSMSRATPLHQGQLPFAPSPVVPPFAPSPVVPPFAPSPVVPPFAPSSVVPGVERRTRRPSEDVGTLLSRMTVDSIAPPERATQALEAIDAAGGPIDNRAGDGEASDGESDDGSGNLPSVLRSDQQPQRPEYVSRGTSAFRPLHLLY